MKKMTINRCNITPRSSNFTLNLLWAISISYPRRKSKAELAQKAIIHTSAY